MPIIQIYLDKGEFHIDLDTKRLPKRLKEAYYIRLYVSDEDLLEYINEWGPTNSEHRFVKDLYIKLTIDKGNKMVEELKDIYRRKLGLIGREECPLNLN